MPSRQMRPTRSICSAVSYFLDTSGRPACCAAGNSPACPSTLAILSFLEFHATASEVIPPIWPQVLTEPTTWWLYPMTAPHQSQQFLQGAVSANDSIPIRQPFMLDALPEGPLIASLLINSSCSFRSLREPSSPASVQPHHNGPAPDSFTRAYLRFVPDPRSLFIFN